MGEVELGSAGEADVGVVITTHNALPWIEQCLASVEGVDTVVVDNDSSDEHRRVRARAVPRRHGDRAGEPRPRRRLGPRPRGASGRRWALILNADAWLVGDALERMVALGERQPESPSSRRSSSTSTARCSARCAASRPAGGSRRSTTTSASSAPTELLNGFYGAGFDHASEREVECVMGACMLVRRAAIDEVGPPDAELLPLQRGGRLVYRFAQAGWRTLFTPDAQCMHVGGASHGGRLYRDNLRGHMRFFLKHHGLAQAESVRSLLRTATVLRGKIVRGEKGAMYRDAARWLGTGDVRSLIER
jgi:GT2 family glycosyltransferase